ncbi:hypothetical protein [Comamonas composti]|uniref:hypothetical protein n=1 Tax=Comamonas composti TaxID=408558 RepID=UPI001FE0F674|nr:hypothetical protein [Comamonas composti]
MASVSSDKPVAPAEDKQLQEKLAAQQAAEQAKQKQEEAKAAKQRQENCREAQSALNTLQAGGLIGHVNAQGERGFMSDEERARQQQRAQEVIRKNCG